jgi:hypothetical protein
MVFIPGMLHCDARASRFMGCATIRDGKRILWDIRGQSEKNLPREGAFRAQALYMTQQMMNDKNRRERAPSGSH